MKRSSPTKTFSLFGFLCCDHEWYRDAPVGSQRRQLWDQSIRISEEATARGESLTSLVSEDFSFFMSFGDRALTQDIVIFFTSMFHEFFSSVSCSATLTMPSVHQSLRYKSSKDTHLHSSYYVLPVSVHSKVTDQLHSLFNIVQAYGYFSNPLIHYKIVQGLSSITPNNVRKDEKYFECLQAHKFPEDQAETVPLNLTSFIHVFHLLLASCSAALVFLVFEKSICKNKRVRDSP